MSRKKSSAAHLANGTYRPILHGARPHDGPALPPAAPPQPKLSEPAAVAWAELVGMVGERLRPEDGPQLEQAAVWLAKWRLIVAALDSEEPGTLAFSRLVSAASTASKGFDRIARKFGLSPLDRDFLNLPPTDPNGGTRW